jgi:hypothetical protein
MKKQSKQIRPLTAFKKAKPEYYTRVYLPLKVKENEFYVWYAIFTLDIKDKDSFFWNINGNLTNKVTLSEIGRLLIYGWYYNIEDWAKNVGGYIYRAYKRKEKTGEVFNDLHFAEAVKHIRENIAVYYHREEELRLYILQKFFNNELQPLLPEKPEELKSLDKALEFIDTQHKNRLKKDKDWYVKHYNNLEEYVAYLQELLETANITDYLTEKEFTEGQKRESRAYWEKIETLEKDYNEQIRGKTLKLMDKLLPGE